MLKQLVLTALVSSLVGASAAGAVAYFTRPVPDAKQQTRLELIEGKLHRIAAVLGLVFGEGE